MGKFTKSDLNTAVTQLSMLAFFPTDPGARAAISVFLAQMCPHREALHWLVAEMVNHIGKWPGPAELRGLLCTRYKPADGIDTCCSLVGYRPCDFEQREIAAMEDDLRLRPAKPVNLRQIAGGKFQ